MNKVLINEFRDGGTVAILFPNCSKNWHIDKRIGANPRGRLFIGYPLAEIVGLLV